MPLPTNVVEDLLSLMTHTSSQESFSDLWKYFAKRVHEVSEEALDPMTPPEKRERLVWVLDVWREIAALPSTAIKESEKTNQPDKAQKAPGAER